MNHITRHTMPITGVDKNHNTIMNGVVIPKITLRMRWSNPLKKLVIAFMA